jgi:hypothetical protein
VRQGRVQKKNNQTLTGNYYNAWLPQLIVDRRRPGPGYRHLLSASDVYRFLKLLPDFQDLTRGLNGIVLASGNPECFGYHVPGVIHLCAWPRDLWITLSREGYEYEKLWLERLCVPCEPCAKNVICKFDEQSARGHQLLATLLHELGHHHDRMATRSQHRAARGEAYAEEYSRKHTELVFERYCREFCV